MTAQSEQALENGLIALFRDTKSVIVVAGSQY